jgi:GT2 family glycosyltransferase
MNTAAEVIAPESEDRGLQCPDRRPSILFLCLARNCASTLPVFFTYLDQLRKVGISCSAIIGENGSTDSTRDLIQAAKPDVTLLDTSFMDEVPALRVRIAVGRQALWDAALAREGREEFVCVADLDQAIATPPQPEAVAEAIRVLRADASLYAVGASSRPVYYDLVSLRAEGFEFLDQLNYAIDRAKKHPLTYYHFHQEHMYSAQKKVTQALPMMCASSFNGFCIYNAIDYRKGCYRAPDEAYICEHVNFNQSVVRETGKKMLVSLSLEIQAPAEHTSVGFLKFWFDRVRRRVTGKR